MKVYQWSDSENEKLRGLSMLAQLVYLRCLRPYVDIDTGIAPANGRIICYEMMRDELQFIPDFGSTKKRWVPTGGQLRAAISELERAGLIEDAGSGVRAGIIKKLCLARGD